MRDDAVNRVRGAMIGSALGDTIGCYTEFLTARRARETYGPSETFSLVDPVTMRRQDAHRSQFEDRAWTDDTDHTILVVLSYLRNCALLPNDFARRLQSWCEKGLSCLNRPPADIGNTIGAVTSYDHYLSDPTGVARHHWYMTGCNSAANGSLMRTIPVGIICINQSEVETFRNGTALGAVTHADPRCAVSVAIVSALIRSLCLGEAKTEADVDAIAERAYTACQSPESPLDRKEFDKHVYAKSLVSLLLCNGGIGYVYKCLGSALWCLREVLSGRETFKSAMVKLVMQGGDADTNGAVAGGLMGAHCGYEGLPPEWRDGLLHREWYLKKIQHMCIILGLAPGTYDAEADPDTAVT